MIVRALHRSSALTSTATATATTALAVLALLVGCASHQGVETQKLPDGTLRIKCQGSLASCLARAEDLCHGTTYDVVRARDQRDRYGPELGTAQVEVRSSEAFVRCGSRGRPLGGIDPLTPPPPAGSDATLATDTTPQRPPAPPAPPPPPPVRACVPGATQACIGPGKCEGGQSCLPDGTAFGPCDCGTLGAPLVAPAGAAPPGNASPPAPTTPSSTGGATPAPTPTTYKPTTPPATPLKTPPAPPPPKK